MIDPDQELSRRAGTALLLLGALLTVGFVGAWIFTDLAGDPLHRTQTPGDYSEPIQESYSADSVGMRRVPEVQIEPLAPPPAAPATQAASPDP